MGQKAKYTFEQDYQSGKKSSDEIALELNGPKALNPKE